MSKTKLMITAALCGMILPSSAVVIWQEDFSGATAGASFGTNANIVGTTVSVANVGTALVVDLNDAANSAVASDFTKGSGNVILLSVGDNDFSGIRLASLANFAPVNDTDTFSFTFDIYIPTLLEVGVASINPRLESNAAAGNGGTFTLANISSGPSLLQTAVGQYTFSYTGTVSDIKNTGSTGNADTAQPFIFFEQKQNGMDDGTTANVAYIDNIKFEIVPEPSTALLGCLGALGLLRRRR